MTKSVVVVGALNADLLVTVSRLPELGETGLASDWTWLAGGKALNVAGQLVASGVPAQLVGTVGDDELAGFLLGRARELGVDTSFVDHSSEPSGLGIVVQDAAGEGYALSVPRANTTRGVLPLPDLTNAAAIVLQCELALDTVTRVAKGARDAGLTIYLNPSPISALPPDLLSLVDTMVVNRVEAYKYSGQTSTREALQQLWPDVPTVIVTLGAEGAIAREQDGRLIHAKAPKVPVTATIGAGDVFLGAFVAARVQGFDLSAALRHGCAAGSVAVGLRSAATTEERQLAITRMLPLVEAVNLGS